MRRAHHLCSRESPPPGSIVDVVTLDYDARHRRRMRITADGGTDLLLDLPRATALRDGDGLLLEGGGVVLVRAAPEPLLEVRSGDAEGLVRLAWHLGNRHLPVQVLSGALRLRADHVIAEMLAGLGADIRAVEAPFDPEGGAYSGDGDAHAHGHAHSHADTGADFDGSESAHG